MQTFSEIVAESFESDVNVVWELKSTTHVVGSFDVKNIRVGVDFEQREPNGPWHVGFSTSGGAAGDPRQLALAFRVFNGVFQAVREFIGTREPTAVVFIAKDEDVAGVYRIYLRREARAIEELGYRLEGPHRVEPYTEWTLRRIKPANWKE